jgi:cysteine-rich repeat protein
MTKFMWNAVAGGPERTVFATASRHTMARAMLVDLSNRTISQSSPIYDSILQPAAVKFPSNLTSDLPMLAYREVDVHLQGHSHSPAAKNLWIRSHLFGVTLSWPRGGGVLNISNLSSPVKLYFPVHTYRMSERERMLFTQQARCVFWENNTYKTGGCTVTAVDGHNVSEGAWPKVLSLSRVTVESHHLTIFAVHQDYRAPACGDSIIQATGGGIVQPYEQCDDEDINGGDGCSARCTIEANYSCFSEPSVCIAWPHPNFGIQGIIKLGEFSRYYDFSRHVDKFSVAMSTSIGFGIKPIDVSVFKACFRGACNTYFDVHVDPEKIRRLGPGTITNNANKVIVYFQVNVPGLPPSILSTASLTPENMIYIDILTKMRSRAYLPDFVSKFALLTRAPTYNYGWEQIPVLLDPKYRPGWKQPQPVPEPNLGKEKGLYKPSDGVQVEAWLNSLAALLGVSVGVVIFLLLFIIFCVTGSICGLHYYYKKTTEKLSESWKDAPEALRPGTPRPKLQKREPAPMVFLQDGIEEVPQDAVLSAGWGAQSIISPETVAEVIEDEVKPPKPALPPPLPPGKMRRPRISTPELKRLRQQADHVSKGLDKLLASIDDEIRTETISRGSTTTGSISDMGDEKHGDNELLDNWSAHGDKERSLGFVPSPPPFAPTRLGTRPSLSILSPKSRGDTRSALEISSTPLSASFIDLPLHDTQSKIARLRRELDRLTAQDMDDVQGEEIFLDALEHHKNDTPLTEIDDEEEDDRKLFAGVHNYSVLRGSFQTGSPGKVADALKRELDRSTSQDMKAVQAEETFVDASEHQKIDTPCTEIHVDVEDQLFAGTHTYSVLRGRSQAGPANPRTPFSRHSPVHADEDEVYWPGTPARSLRKALNPQSFRSFTPPRIPSSIQRQVQYSPDEEEYPFFAGSPDEENLDSSQPQEAPSQRWAVERSTAAGPRTPFSRQEPVPDSPVEEEDQFYAGSPDEIERTSTAATFQVRSRGELALLGSLSASNSRASVRAQASQHNSSSFLMDSPGGTPYIPRGLRTHVQSTADFGAEAAGSRILEDELLELADRRPQWRQFSRPTQLSPLASTQRQSTFSVREESDRFNRRAAAASYRADGLFQLRASFGGSATTVTSPERRNVTWNTHSNEEAVPAHVGVAFSNRTPRTSPERRNEARTAQAQFSSPRSPSRLVDDDRILEVEDLI